MPEDSALRYAVLGRRVLNALLQANFFCNSTFVHCQLTRSDSATILLCDRLQFARADEYCSVKTSES